MEINELYGLPDGKDVEDALVRLRTRIEELGVEVEDEIFPRPTTRGLSARLQATKSRFTRKSLCHLHRGLRSRIFTGI